MSDPAGLNRADWRVAGSYLEARNCGAICPCRDRWPRQVLGGGLALWGSLVLAGRL